MTAAVIAAAVLITLAAVGCILLFLAREMPHGRHARRAAPFADPADAADPDGSRYVEQLGEPIPRITLSADASQAIDQLRGIQDKIRELDPSIPPWQADGEDWWDQLPPPPLVEALQAQGCPVDVHPQETPDGLVVFTSTVTPQTLARIRDKLDALPPAPPAMVTLPGPEPEPPAPRFMPAPPDATITDLPAVTSVPAGAQS